MTSIKILAAVVAVVIVVGGAGLCLMNIDPEEDPVDPDTPVSPTDPVVPDQPVIPDKPAGPDIPVGPDVPTVGEKGHQSDWTQWLGGTGTPGVSDARTPITKADMREVWKVTGDIGSSSSNWTTPGSAICIGDLTYYYNGSDNTLRCVETSTGKIVRSATCESKAVYNMAICYGDGKIFVPTSSGGSTTMVAFDADTLEQLFRSEPVGGGEVQGPITYNNGRVFFGTYGGDFACFPSEDTDPDRRDEVVTPEWVIEGKGGWYNAAPAFIGDACVVLDMAAIAYLVDTDTGAILDSMDFEGVYCSSGAAVYEGRVYIALNISKYAEDPDSSNKGKMLTIHSFEVTDGSFDRSSERIWTSQAANGGTQSIPVIWNDRLYICGGGSTMGSDEPFTVIDIADDGTMTTAYTVPIKSKSTVSLTTAYSAGSNGYAVYIYIIEYGKVNAGEAADSQNGSADIYCLKDSAGQGSANVVFSITPSLPQFAFQSFSISPDGHLLIRNDRTLFCYGASGTERTASDVRSDIDRIISFSESGKVLPADVLRAEQRYAELDYDGKAKVTNYDDLQTLYRTVTFVVGDGAVKDRFIVGSLIDAPEVGDGNGSVFRGWSDGSRMWDVSVDRISSDIILTAVFGDAHTVSFDSNGGSSVGSILVGDGDVMGYVHGPTRNGYSFGGWFSGDVGYTPQASKVSSDLVLKARWLKDSTIVFDSNGGSSAKSISVTEGLPVGKLPQTSRSGYAFVGWFHDGTMFTEDTVYPYTYGITLVAKWTENPEVAIDTGKGVRVTGVMPDGAEVTVTEKPNLQTASKTAISNAANGAGLEYFMIKIYGDGVDGTQSYHIDIDVNPSMNGKAVDVYYYVYQADPEVTHISGVVKEGVLSIDMKGSTSSKGVEIEFGMTPDTGLADRL